MAFHYAVSGEWAKATIAINEATPLCEQHEPEAMIYMDNLRAVTEAIKGGNKQALLYAQKAYSNPYFKRRTDVNKWATYMQLGRMHGALKHTDSAAYYDRIVLRLVKKYATVLPNLADDSYVLFGDVALQQKNYAEALRNYKLSTDYPKIANVYQLLGNHDSTVYYALLGLKIGQIRDVPAFIHSSAHTLAEEYAKSNPREANKYLTMYAKSKDKFYNTDKQTQFEQIKLAEQRTEYESQQKQATVRNRIIFFQYVVLYYFS